MTSLLRFGLPAGLALGVAMAAGAAAAEVAVVASIKPVHSLTAAVMRGIGTPHLIVTGGASPHSLALKPSDAAALQGADVVVWVGEGLETFLAGAIETLARDARVVKLAEAPGLTRLGFRSGGTWEEDDHGQEERGEEERGEMEAHGHGHEEIDQHFWLDPLNARAMVQAIAQALIAADPANAALYADNARRVSRDLAQLSEEIARELAPVKNVPFVVFHDAFQYFDARFGLANVGSVTVSPEQKPGAARLREIRQKIAELGVRCVFAEPQFEPRLVDVVIDGTAARRGTLDPVGADLADGPGLYFEMMRANARAVRDCLGGSS